MVLLKNLGFEVKHAEANFSISNSDGSATLLHEVTDVLSGSKAGLKSYVRWRSS